MRRIFIVRHGQSTANAEKTVTGQRDVGLTPLGEVQARHAGQEAAALDIDLIVSSTLQRARHTARIIAEACHYPADDIVFTDNLRERFFGELEGQSYAHNRRHTGDYPEAEHVAGIEPLELFRSRVASALSLVLQESSRKNILIVSHMNVGRMLLTIAHGKEAMALYDQAHLENAHIYRLT